MFELPGRLFGVSTPPGSVSTAGTGDIGARSPEHADKAATPTIANTRNIIILY